MDQRIWQFDARAAEFDIRPQGENQTTQRDDQPEPAFTIAADEGKAQHRQNRQQHSNGEIAVGAAGQQVLQREGKIGCVFQAHGGIVQAVGLQ